MFFFFKPFYFVSEIKALTVWKILYFMPHPLTGELDNATKATEALT